MYIKSEFHPSMKVFYMYFISPVLIRYLVMLQKILRDFTRRREDMNFMLERQEQHISNDLFVLFCFVLFFF